MPKKLEEINIKDIPYGVEVSSRINFDKIDLDLYEVGDFIISPKDPKVINMKKKDNRFYKVVAA